MALTTYPASDLDQPGVLAGLLGSFWSSTYGNPAELTAALRGLGRVYRQAERSFAEILASVRFDSIPLRHVEEWVPLTLLASNVTNPSFAVPVYATGGNVYGAAGLYGVPASLAQFPVSIAPADGVWLLCDDIVAPQVVLVAGIDFRVDATNQVAWLNQDPFANPNLQPTQLFDTAGSPSDKQLTLWAWRAQVDQGLLQSRIGYVLGITLPSTEPARDLAVAMVDALVNGTSDLTLRRIFSALYDTPLARCTGEVVDVVALDRDGLFVATDRLVYRFPAAATPVVVPGQVLEAGDALVDTLQFSNLSNGIVPDDVTALSLGPANLGAAYTQGLAWANVFTPVDAAPMPPGG